MIHHEKKHVLSLVRQLLMTEHWSSVWHWLPYILFHSLVSVVLTFSPNSSTSSPRSRSSG